MDYNSKIKLNEKIILIENKDVLKNIFEIAKEDLIINGKKKYSKNSSGIYFDLLLISDENLLKIKELIYNYFSETDSEINNIKENLIINHIQLMIKQKLFKVIMMDQDYQIKKKYFIKK